MLSGDMARSQIADRVREAEAVRLARTARGAAGGSVLRRSATSIVAILLWPFRH
jgi:hypothetical protein